MLQDQLSQTQEATDKVLKPWHCPFNFSYLSKKKLKGIFFSSWITYYTKKVIVCKNFDLEKVALC